MQITPEPYTATTHELIRWISAIKLSDYPPSEIFHMVNSETLPYDDENKTDLSLYLSGTDEMGKDELIEHLKAKFREATTKTNEIYNSL